MTDAKAALDAWRFCYEEWASAEIALSRLPFGPDRVKEAEALRFWWNQTSELLLAAVHLEVHFGLRPDPPIHELLARLSIMAADLANGNLPTLAAGVVTQGRPKTWDAERRDIGKAVRYIEAVKAGIIPDKKPNATVRDAFSVSAPTVRQWCQSREHYLHRLPALIDQPERVTREMLEAGQSYRCFGRGAAAITSRAGKRR